MMGRSIGDVMNAKGPCSSDTKGDLSKARDGAEIPCTSTGMADEVIQKNHANSESFAPDAEGSMQIAPGSVESHGADLVYVPSPRGLVDPLFKDFSQLTRSYMAHCKPLFPSAYSCSCDSNPYCFIQSAIIWPVSLHCIPMSRIRIAN